MEHKTKCSVCGQGTDEKLIQELVNGFYISTIFLCVMHGTVKEPYWYETMIFDRRTDPDSFMDVFCERYRTRAQAIRGHEEAKELVLNGEFK